MIYTYQYLDQTYTVQLEPLSDRTYRITIGDDSRIVDAQWLSEGRLRLVVDGKQSQAFVGMSGSERYVKVDEQQAKTLFVEDLRVRRKSGHAGSDAHLTAQMPGQVVDVLVNVNDVVESGDTLIILEAMKMEIRISAPNEGVVSQLFVQKGDVVERGQQLLDIISKDKEE